MKLFFGVINQGLVFETNDTFIEQLFVQTSDSLGLTGPNVKESENTLDGLRLRRNRRLTDQQKQSVVDSPLLTEKQKKVFEFLYCQSNECSDSQDIINGLLSLDCDCLSDVKEWIEEKEIDVNLINIKRQ